ncbi:TetR/AcrR family transcriptional regulator [Demequina sp. NBRC 110057]|uniref:TetR/AcrR family transcriptional regulator n=1 Tax=Demequina sp. NBRC 110057 TaxID=1570346 RepID=UPI0013565A27|nr:TetR/AcrR family transcriptional regulator [Demequina sp. NBRC 110057]
MSQDTGAKRGRAQTTARLLDAAEDLLAVRGTDLGIDDVCQRAGFTRGAFYSNFSSMTDLLFAVYERRTEALLGRLAAADPELPSEATLGGLVDYVLDLIPAEPDWYALRASFARQQHLHADSTQSLRDHGEELREGLEPLVLAIVAAAGRRLTLDAAAAVRALIAANVGAVLQAPLVEDPDTLRRDTILATLSGLTIPVAAHDGDPASA